MSAWVRICVCVVGWCSKFALCGGASGSTRMGAIMDGLVIFEGPGMLCAAA